MKTGGDSKPSTRRPASSFSEGFAGPRRTSIFRSRPQRAAASKRRPATSGSSVRLEEPEEHDLFFVEVVVGPVEDRRDPADVGGSRAAPRRAASPRAGRRGSRRTRPSRRPTGGARPSSGRLGRAGRRRRRSGRGRALPRPIGSISTGSASDPDGGKQREPRGATFSIASSARRQLSARVRRHERGADEGPSGRRRR